MTGTPRERTGTWLTSVAAVVLLLGSGCSSRSEPAPTTLRPWSPPRSALVLAAARSEPGPEAHRRDVDLGHGSDAPILLDVVQIRIRDHVRSSDGRPRDHHHQDGSGLRVRRRR